MTGKMLRITGKGMQEEITSTKPLYSMNPQDKKAPL